MKYPQNLQKSINDKITLHQKSIKQQYLTNVDIELKINIPDDYFEKVVNFLLKTISEREKDIIIEYFKNEKTLKEVGDKINLTPERIRQLLNVAISKMLKEEKVLFFIIGKNKTLEIIKTNIKNYINQPVSEYKFTNSDLDLFKIKGISTYKELYDSRIEFLEMENDALKKRIKRFSSKYETTLTSKQFLLLFE